MGNPEATQDVPSIFCDVTGRLTVDRITAFGAGVDTAVQRLSYFYDVQGRVTLATSIAAPYGGAVVNQVARGYSGFGQLINEWQAHTGGAVNGVTPVVNYVYTNAGNGNNSRLAWMNYPSGYTLYSVYADGSIDAAMHRPTSLWGAKADTGTTASLEAFKYLGASTVVERARSEIDTTFTVVPGTTPGSAGDKYTGLDRFGRVVDQRWAKGPGGNGAIVAQNAYTYDRNGNRLSDSIYGTNYTYDDLNQVQSFTRASHAPGVKNQQFAFDALGNWNTLTTDGSAQSRVTNAQNEVTSVGGTTLLYSEVGNMLNAPEGRVLRYDAWNRLVTVSNSSNTLLARYQYDAFNRRITEQVATPAIPNADLAPVRDLYYSDQWQVLEERVRTTPSVVASTADTRYIWSPVYVDALIARDRNADGNAATGTGGLEQRVYALQDGNWNTHAIVAASGVPGYATGQVINRFIYTPFGEHQVLDNAYWAAPAAIPWDRLFQGHEYTDTTKLTHMRNRDYSASLGRFVQRDPIGFAAGDNNVYRFVGNGPTVSTDPSGLEANLWNPFTWDHGSADGSWWNFVNPVAKINRDTLWGTGAGAVQGTCNIANGVQDIGIGIANTPATAVNAIAWTEEQLGWVDPDHGFRVPYIYSPDWSRDLVTHEPGSGWTDTHGWSKFIGGTSVTIGATALRLRYAQRCASAPKSAFDPFLGAGGEAGFGKLVNWGVGARGATARTASITNGELQQMGMTREVAQHWLDFYKSAVTQGRGAATAPERIKLMERILELLD